MQQKMVTRSGYEHRYRIRTDDALIPLYNSQPLHLGVHRRLFKNGFIFEIRTNFMLKTNETDSDVEIIASEKLVAAVPSYAVPADLWLFIDVSYRLQEYWMSADEIDRLVREAVDFTNLAVENNHNYYASLAAIPIVVDVDVVTVKLEGESVETARGRVIGPQCLIPLNMCPMGPYMSPFRPALPAEVRAIYPYFMEFLLGMPSVRVEDVEEGLAVMEICPICLRAPNIGVQICSLPCDHAFHHHCLVPWLMRSKSCPICRFDIVV